VKDAGAACAFYQKAFGFEMKVQMAGPDGKPGHTEMAYRDALIMFGPESASDGACKAPATLGVNSPVLLYAYCDDVDALFQRATTAGARADLAPTTMFWGDRICKLTDPDGHVWNFATNVADFGSSQAPH
jgi:PhnB protein